MAEAHATEREPAHDVSLDCGWGRLHFAQTFGAPEALRDALRREEEHRRDIAFYVTEPQVLLSLAPQRLFLDPSFAFRLDLTGWETGAARPQGIEIAVLESEGQARAVADCYAKWHMAPIDPQALLDRRGDRRFLDLVAHDAETGGFLGTLTGLDHVEVFGDPEGAASFWCLAVDPQSSRPGVGEALLRAVADRMAARGRQCLDLSVMWDNEEAIALYEKLGFRRLPVFAMKAKNPINEQLFAPPLPDERNLNPYAQIVVDEARRRGIAVEVLDAEGGFFRLTLGGRSVVCRESLSELTTAVAMSRCDDKAVTHRLLAREGLRVPAQTKAGDAEQDRAFLERCGRVVVKPLRGEQGIGVFVDLTTADEVEHAVAEAKKHCETVLLEEFVTGSDLRLIVIDYRVVAAAVRKPAEVTGTGRHSVRQLIEKQSRRRAQATHGESAIPIDAETRRTVEAAGYALDDVLPEGTTLAVRKAANLHTGGTIHDVTDRLHPALVSAAERAARALDIPVVGLDMLVEAPEAPNYAIVEANERPGLANHEPAPTAERFVDLLFPQTAEAARTGRRAGRATAAEDRTPRQEEVR